MKRVVFLLMLMVFTISLSLAGCGDSDSDSDVTIPSESVSVYEEAKLSENQVYMEEAMNDETREIIKNLEYVIIEWADNINGEFYHYYIDIVGSLPAEAAIYYNDTGTILVLEYEGYHAYYEENCVTYEDVFGEFFVAEFKPINNDIVSVCLDGWETTDNIIALLYLDQAIGAMLNGETAPFEGY
ncbi:MAG: hypothetical protein ACOX4R_00870 [Lentihominibacter sp.]|jgi:hypothetical protein